MLETAGVQAISICPQSFDCDNQVFSKSATVINMMLIYLLFLTLYPTNSEGV